MLKNAYFLEKTVKNGLSVVRPQPPALLLPSTITTFFYFAYSAKMRFVTHK